VEFAENNIHITIKELIERKSKRDGSPFTIYQLAKALNMPHSMLIRLIHPDLVKRVNNPRIDTLSRIVEFFRADGFNITIDDLLVGFKTRPAVNIQSQVVDSVKIQKIVPLYSLDTILNKIGTVDVNLMENSNNIIALLSDEDIKPIFKRGSIFIIDTELKPKDDTLVAAKIENHDKILLRKFYQIGNKKILKSYNDKTNLITLLPTMQYSILGVVIQIYAKT
jgi:hypothetical protein